MGVHFENSLGFFNPFTMNLLFRIGMFSLLLGTAGVSAQQTSDSLSAYQALSQGKFWLDSLQYDSAEFYFNRAARQYQVLAMANIDSAMWGNYMVAQAGIGETLYGNDQYVQAVEKVSLALEKGKQLLGENHPQLAKCYLVLGKSHRQLRNYGKGIPLLIKARDLLEAKWGKEHEEVAGVYSELGINYWYSGNRQQARKYLTEALEVRKQLLGPGHPNLFKAYTNLGIIAWQEADYEEAIWLTKEAICLFAYEHGEDHPDLSKNYNNLGAIYEELGDYEQALHFAHKALEVRLKVEDRNTPTIATNIANVGHIYRSLGQYEKASEYYQEALDIRLKTLPAIHANIADSYAHKASIFSRKGDYDQALTYFEKALQIRLTLFGKSHPRIAETYSALGATHWYKGDYEKTLDYYHQVQAFWESYYKDSPHPQLAGIYNNLGIVYWRNGDFLHAVDFYQKAQDIYRAVFGNEHPAIAENTLNIGLVYLNQAEETYPKALTYFQRTLSIEQKLFPLHHPHLVNAYNHIGKAYALLNQPDSALWAFQRAFEANAPQFKSERLTDVPDYDTPILDDLRFLRTIETIAETQAERKDGTVVHWQAADSLFGQWALWVDHMNQGYLQEGSQLGLLDRAWPMYEKAIENAMQLFEGTQDSAYLDRAFYFAGKGKAMLLNQAIRAPKAREFAGIPAEVVERERELKKQLSDCRQQWSSALGKSSTDSLALAELQNTLFKLQQSNDSIRLVLEVKYPNYYQLLYESDPASIHRVQAYLEKENQALVSFFWGDSRLYTFTLTPKSVNIRGRKLDSTLVNPLQAVHQTVSGFEYAFNEASYREKLREFSQNSAQLYQELLASEESTLEAYNSIIIIPDGQLDYLPFEVLLTDSVDPYHPYKNLPFFIRKASIQYAFSPRSLLEDTDFPFSRNPSYAGFAPSYANGESVTPVSLSRSRYSPLTHNRREIEEVGEMMEGQLYLGNAATKTAFQEDIGRQRIVHLAMHAFVDDHNPLASGLVFASDDSTQEAEILRAYEIYALELSTELVVLSACQTGIGKQQRGEGMMSLARAFRYAGCPSIVTSLWQANDPTTQKLMVSFFQYLKSGNTKAEALQKAKLDFLNHATIVEAHPFHWAPFVLIGEDDPVQRGSGLPYWAYVVLGIGGLIMVIGLARKYVKS